MITTTKEYIEERYDDLEKNFLNDTGKLLGKNYARLQSYCLNEWQKILVEAAEQQQKLSVPCAYMSISLLNTSLLVRHPEWQIDFYNGEWFYGKSWFRRRMSADFLFERWDDFCRRALDDKFYVRSFIPPAAIKALFWETVDKLAYLAACFAKYWAADIGKLSGFAALIKEPVMYVTCGVYLDWQERIYGVLPPMSLIDVPDNEETTFREFTDTVYTEITVSDLNLSHGRFYRIKFIQTVFKTVDLKDAYFEDCVFDNVHFVETQIAGCRWINCRFKNCTWQNSGTNVEGDEYFGETEMKRCYITNNNIFNSDFSHFMLTDCRGNNLNLMNTTTDHESWQKIRY